MTSTIAFDVIARDKATSTFSRISRSSDSARRSLVSFGKATAGLVGFTSLTTAAAGFIKVGADYSTSLNKIQALAGLTNKQLDKVGSSLESQSGSFAKLGQSTGDAASGMVELVKAGLSAKDALAAVQQTMVLAKAGELDIADASSLVANTLNTFGMKAKDAGDIANYLANAANISSADVSDLAESMKYVAPVAAATGVSLKQTSAILAELSNSGIAASNAGTGFRKFLLSLQAPSGAAKDDLKALGVEIFDAQGKMKPLGKVIDSLGGSLNHLTDKGRQKVLKDIFGLQGISSATVILKGGAKGLDEYTRGVGKAGAAARLANANSKGFAGSLRTLRAEVISTAQAEYRQLEPSLEAASHKLQVFFEQMRTGKGAGGEFVSTLKTLATAAKDVVKFVDAIPGPVKKLGVEALVAGYALKKLSALTTMVGTTFASTSAKTKQFAAEMTYSETRMQRVATAGAALGGALRQVGGVGGMIALTDGAKRSNKALGALEMAAGGAALGFAVGGPLGAAIGGTAGGLLGLAKASGDSTKAVKVSLPTWREYGQTLDGVSAAITRETRALVLERLQKSGLLDATRKLGLSDREAVNAMTGSTLARKRLADAIQNTSRLTLDQKEALEKETGSVARSRLQTLQNNVAIAQNATELKNAKAALAAFMKQPANKRISITGAESAVAKINDIRRSLMQVLGLTKDINTAGPGGLGVLLGAPLKSGSSGSTRTAPHGATSPRTSTGGSWTGTRNWGLPGSTGTSGTSPRALARDGERAGSVWVGGLIKGITSHQIQAQTAADKLHDIMSRVSDKIANLKSLRSDFKSTFTSDSIFGADMETTGSLAGLMQFQADQQAKAQQLLADVQRLKTLGLSKSLLTQLQNSGSAGAAQLHLLASGSQSDINQFNSMDKATQQALQQAGLSVGNGIRGGSINADIRHAEKQNHLLYQMLKELQHLNDGYVVQIGADGFIKVLRKAATAKGTTVTKLLDG